MQQFLYKIQPTGVISTYKVTIHENLLLKKETTYKKYKRNTVYYTFQEARSFNYVQILKYLLWLNVCQF